MRTTAPAVDRVFCLPVFLTDAGSFRTASARDQYEVMQVRRSGGGRVGLQPGD